MENGHFNKRFAMSHVQLHRTKYKRIYSIFCEKRRLGLGGLQACYFIIELIKIIRNGYRVSNQCQDCSGDYTENENSIEDINFYITLRSAGKFLTENY
jgi:hypothetical protein